jgi:acetyltransferase-like isoleucine patch superfamily enzyme
MEEKKTSRETIVETLSNGRRSPHKTYQALFVGSESVIDFVKYEVLTFLLTYLPGAAGLFFRKVFYPSLFGKIGQGVAFGSGITLRCPRKIVLGENVFIDNNAVLDAKGSESHIDFGNSVLVGRNTILSCASSKIALGDDVSIGPHCHLRAGLCPIQIGSHVTVGSHSAIVSGNPGYTRLDIPMKIQIGSTEGITIGDDVWIGVGVRITDGVSVGSGCVIGAGAVVLENIPDYAIAAGVPAKVIGNRKK